MEYRVYEITLAYFCLEMLLNEHKRFPEMSVRVRSQKSPGKTLIYQQRSISYRSLFETIGERLEISTKNFPQVMRFFRIFYKCLIIYQHNKKGVILHAKFAMVCSLNLTCNVLTSKGNVCSNKRKWGTIRDTIKSYFPYLVTIKKLACFNVFLLT